ncbi:hypothetical protein B0H10DRAFT_2227790 [Mycena sp. CBHHK59/15]|nr:hypothetical protein B0H10DRAFT_2227790 [Mycena sp. CBHHK59/15]
MGGAKREDFAGQYRSYVGHVAYTLEQANQSLQCPHNETKTHCFTSISPALPEGDPRIQAFREGCAEIDERKKQERAKRKQDKAAPKPRAKPKPATGEDAPPKTSRSRKQKQPAAAVDTKQEAKQKNPVDLLIEDAGALSETSSSSMSPVPKKAKTQGKSRAIALPEMANDGYNSDEFIIDPAERRLIHIIIYTQADTPPIQQYLNLRCAGRFDFMALEIARVVNAVPANGATAGSATPYLWYCIKSYGFLSADGLINMKEHGSILVYRATDLAEAACLEIALWIEQAIESAEAQSPPYLGSPATEPSSSQTTSSLSDLPSQGSWSAGPSSSPTAFAVAGPSRFTGSASSPSTSVRAKRTYSSAFHNQEELFLRAEDKEEEMLRLNRAHDRGGSGGMTAMSPPSPDFHVGLFIWLRARLPPPDATFASNLAGKI